MKYFKYLGAKMMGRSLGKERLGFFKNQNKKKNSGHTYQEKKSIGYQAKGRRF